MHSGTQLKTITIDLFFSSHEKQFTGFNFDNHNYFKSFSSIKIAWKPEKLSWVTIRQI